ncbi:hypothetical protein D3C74_360800 [compost metagenome]
MPDERRERRGEDGGEREDDAGAQPGSEGFGDGAVRGGGGVLPEVGPHGEGGGGARGHPCEQGGQGDDRRLGGEDQPSAGLGLEREPGGTRGVLGRHRMHGQGSEDDETELDGRPESLRRSGGGAGRELTGGDRVDDVVRQDARHERHGDQDSGQGDPRGAHRPRTTPLGTDCGHHAMRSSGRARYWTSSATRSR